MLLPLWLFHWIFLSWWISVLFPSTNKVREKAEYLICSLASNFWPVTNIRKTWTWEFVLSLNSWNLNLKSKRVHLPRSWQKKPVYRPPGGEMKNEEAELSFVTPKARKKSQRSQKAKRSSNQIKRVKENAWMLKLGEVC